MYVYNISSLFLAPDGSLVRGFFCAQIQNRLRRTEMIKWLPDGKWKEGSTAVVATTAECAVLITSTMSSEDRAEALDSLRRMIRNKRRCLEGWAKAVESDEKDRRIREDMARAGQDMFGDQLGEAEDIG
jgi:hypothetical protein